MKKIIEENNSESEVGPDEIGENKEINKRKRSVSGARTEVGE